MGEGSFTRKETLIHIDMPRRSIHFPAHGSDTKKFYRQSKCLKSAS